MLNTTDASNWNVESVEIYDFNSSTSQYENVQSKISHRIDQSLDITGKPRVRLALNWTSLHGGNTLINGILRKVPIIPSSSIQDSAINKVPLIITGIFDGQITFDEINEFDKIRGVELYAFYDIPDLSRFHLGISIDGSGGPTGTAPATNLYEFPADSIESGTYIYIVNSIVAFQQFFDTSQLPPFYLRANPVMGNLNGNDSIELIEQYNNVNNDQRVLVLGSYGDPYVNGTGQIWEYTDGWAYRRDRMWDQGFNSTDWTYNVGGLDTFENSTCTNPFPIATYIHD